MSEITRRAAFIGIAQSVAGWMTRFEEEIASLSSAANRRSRN
ncbi:hypothetical protein [Chroococcidiopsis sp. CCMEE 29]|nr:hypothetical protein [Chroococcidiopsis sp. CCMEE 29]